MLLPHRLSFALAALAAVAPLRAQDAERYSIAGNATAIYNLAGTVRVEPGGGANVVVEVRRGGRDADRLEIERHEVAGRAALIVKYGDDDVVYRSARWKGTATVNVRSDGSFYDGRGGERVTIRSSGRGLEAHADLRVLVPPGKSVAIRLGIGEVNASNIEGNLDVEVASAPVQISGTRGDLRIDTGSGRVRVSDAEGNVRVDTGSGSVEVTDVRGDLEVDTGSGSVTGGGITAASVRIDTGSGSIQLRSVAARELELDTGSGSITLDLASDVEHLRIDTGSGGVRLSVPADLGAELDADTGSGGITIDVPIQVTRRERDHVTGRIGDGRGRIEIDTGSGGIRISRR